jgi:hypothetical protein
MSAIGSTEGGSTKPKQVLLLLILAGFVCLLISISLESRGFISSLLEAASFFGKFLEHLGVALLIAAFVGLMLESEEYSKYFLRKVADTIVKSDYLAKLEKKEMESLQKSLVETYFKLDNIDVEQGFYRYFLQLYKYIDSPYREQTRGTVSIQYVPDSNRRIFKIEETISFTCRKVRDCIQKELKWNAEMDELKGMESFSVKVTVPSDIFNSETFKNTYPNLKEKEMVFDSKKENPDLVRYDKGHGYTLNLKKYGGIDGLRVYIETTYLSSVDRGLSWTMSDPSKGVSLIINYPNDLKIQVDKFGINPDELSEPGRQGAYRLEYHSWLLPDSGFAFHFLKAGEGDKDDAGTTPPPQTA